MEFMKKRSFLLIIALAGIATMFIAVGIHAGTEVCDVIKMENAAYDKVAAVCLPRSDHTRNL